MRAMPAAAALAAFLIACGVARLLLSALGRRLPLDRPNQRSLHDRPVPRSGGLAILAGAAASFLLGAADAWLPFALALVVGAISFADDVVSLPALVRLAAHLGIAGGLLWYLLSPIHPLVLIGLVLAVAWITNLYNFMDGSDGLAGGMAVIGFGAYALAAEGALATLSAGIAAAAAGFLVFNFHPARIFMGDVGSIPLGFLAGALGVLGWRNDFWPLWFPLLVFGPFIGDATVTLLRRVARRERVWEAHREHYYQRLVRLGFGHRGTAYLGYAAMLVCAAAALTGRTQPPALQGLAFAGASTLLATLAVWVDLRWARHGRAS